MDTNTGTAPLTVTFTNASTGDNLTYEWNFGDGSQLVADANPSHEYTVAGSYNVTLTATNSAGSNTSTPQTITVNVAAVAPLASFTMDTPTGDAPLTVAFTSTSTGDFNTFTWSFVDANNNVIGTADAPTTSFTFPTAGIYTATLTVNGLGGSNMSAPQTITVNAAVVAPIANFTMDTNTGTAPLTVTFTNASTGDNLTYEWNFGDGSPVVADANPSHEYAIAGTYAVTVTAANSAGSNTSAPQTITVNAAAVAPLASFTTDTATGDAPLTVTFTSTSTGDNLTYSWDFGDNSPVSAEQNPSHVYSQEGQYNAVLTVTNAGGINTSTPQSIIVNAAKVVPVPPPINRPLLFVSNRSGNDEIYLLDTDGTVTNLSNNGANDNSPSWSPDGNRIAFVSNRDGNDEIYVMNADGSNVVRLTDNPATESSPVWAANGSLIGFATSRDGNYEIYTMSAADGSNPVNVTNAPTSNETSPAPSPDGTRLAFMSDRDGNNEIYVQTSDGTATNVSNSAGSTDSSPAWSPDGRIVFVSDRESLAQIYVMGADGSSPTRISDLSRPDTHPVWSSSNQIAFVSQDNGLSQIYVMNQDGTGVTKVSDGTGNDSAPVWKP